MINNKNFNTPGTFTLAIHIAIKHSKIKLVKLKVNSGDKLQITIKKIVFI
jgi:hypothetical protein